MKKLSLLVRILILASLTSALGGCVAAIGNREPAKSSATLGQQLIDLKKARDEGALTEMEYSAQRAKFLGGK